MKDPRLLKAIKSATSSLRGMTDSVIYEHKFVDRVVCWEGTASEIPILATLRLVDSVALVFEVAFRLGEFHSEVAIQNWVIAKRPSLEPFDLNISEGWVVFRFKQEIFDTGIEVDFEPIDGWDVVGIALEMAGQMINGLRNQLEQTLRRKP